MSTRNYLSREAVIRAQHPFLKTLDSVVLHEIIGDRPGRLVLVILVSLLSILSACSPKPKNLKVTDNGALFKAAMGTDVERIKVLLESGADVNVREAEIGITPLFNVRCSAVAKYLLSKGAQVDVVSYTGLQPIHSVTETGNIELIRTLLDAGASANASISKPTRLVANSAAYVSAEGRTPLHIAAHYGNSTAIKLLLSKGASVDSQTIIGMTPLGEACVVLQQNCVDVLLAAGAKTNQTNNLGLSPMHLAVSASDNAVNEMLGRPDANLLTVRTQILRSLVSHGADVGAKTKDGSTIVDIAKTNNCVDALRPLNVVKDL